MRNRDIFRWGRRASAVAPAIAVGLSIAPSGASAQTVLPDINVIAPSPLSGTRSAKPKRSNAPTAPASQTGAPSEQAPAVTNADPTLIDRDKVPSSTSVLTSADFDHEKSTNLLDSLARTLPGVSLGDATGNVFQRDLNFRGFVASPVQGTPQGIAVYQNGVRVNESWGDVVNWDFIPEKAINRTSLFPNNPVFGLNAVGGALSIEMKNGFTYQGTELEALIGSYGRAQTSVQMGKQDGNLSAYVAFDSAYDKGWRDFSSSSHLNRMYADVGARNDQTEFHVNFTAADNLLGGTVATPVELLNQKWSSVWTWPQTAHLELAFLNASLNHSFSDTLSFQSNAYFRGFWQAHVDGNGTDAQPCDPLGTTLCIGDAFTSLIQGVSVPNALGNAFLGEIDRNWTTTNSFGGSAQITSADKIFGHDNHFIMGISVDHGRTQFTGSSELGTIDQNLFISGTGVFINQPDAGLSPVNLHAINTYTGIYATDTIDVTSRLAVTAGGRFNVAQINLEDQTGLDPLLNSSNQYQRFNPVIGATYKITPNFTAYAGYSEANRAPTPLELACADPQHPCMVDNFLISDPPLKQVVSHTVEAGLRGGFGKDAKTGQLTWGLGVFHTESDDDIINVASALVPNFGFFQNAGKTLRQGVEAKLDYRQDRWSAYANYSFVDATYQSAMTLQSPNSPFAVQSGPNAGDIFVKPGDRIPGIPAHRFKAGVDYAVTDAWKVGADLNVVGTQYLIHDDSNQAPKVPAYAVLNLHTSYQLTPNVEVFGLINNALNQHYYVAGTFFDTGGFTSANPNIGNFLALNDPRTFLPGMPFAAYAGLRAKF